MFFFKPFFSYIILVVLMLISVAIVTLLEQKILGGTSLRIGPNTVGYWGFMQPFADAVKLFLKEGLQMSYGMGVYLSSPIMSLSLAFLFWGLYPFFFGGFDINLGTLWFFCVSGVSVFPILLMGWVSNCKYSMQGSLRGVAQMISYEVSFLFIILSVIWCYSTLEIKEFMNNQVFLASMFLFFPLSMMWLVSSLAETNRSPYDFSEGESELVSGFNTEYSAGGFTLIFMSEYSNILFLSILFSVIFLGGGYVSVVLKGMVISFFFMWIRASFPRFRYDKLMYLAWKSFLPFSMFSFLFFFSIS